jgi:hypothetical protein
MSVMRRITDPSQVSGTSRVGERTLRLRDCRRAIKNLPRERIARLGFECGVDPAVTIREAARRHVNTPFWISMATHGSQSNAREPRRRQESGIGYQPA